MFDPVFSILFVSAILIPMAGMTFVVAKNLMPLGAAVLLAFMEPTASLLGYVVTTLMQIRLDPYFDNESFATRGRFRFLAVSFSRCWRCGWCCALTGDNTQ